MTRKRFLVWSCGACVAAFIILPVISKWTGRPGAAAPTVRRLCRMTAFKGQIYALAVTRNGDSVAITDSVGKLGIYNTQTGTLRHQLSPNRGSLPLVFSSDGKLLICDGRPDGIQVWNLPARRLVGSFKGHPGMAIQEYLDYVNGKSVPARMKVKADVTGIALSHDARTLASASNDGTIELWDIRRRKLLRVLRVRKSQFTTVAFSQSGIVAGGTQSGDVFTWDAKSGRALRSKKPAQFPSAGLAFTNGGQVLVTISQQGETNLLDARTLKSKGTAAADGPTPVIDFSADGRRYIVNMTGQTGYCQYGNMAVRDCATSRILYELACENIGAAALSGDGNLLAVSGVNYDKKFKAGQQVFVDIYKTG